MRYYVNGSLENIMVFSALANLASTNRIRCEKRHTFNTMVGFNALNTYPIPFAVLQPILRRKRARKKQLRAINPYAG